jgi:T5SS/PEP-CTERM-associated repeat protein
LAQTYSVTFGSLPPAIQNLTVSAGTVTFRGSVPGITLSVNSGGEQDLILTGASTSLILGTSISNPLNLTLGDDVQVRGGATLDVRFGSDVNTLDLLVGTMAAGGNGTVVVDGFASKLNSTTTTSVGVDGASGSLTYRNAAQGALTTAGTVYIGDTSNSSTVGTLNVESNADLDVGNLNIGTAATGSATGVVNVQGTGSTLDILGSILTVGSAAGGSGAINIGTTSSGAVFTTGTGLFTINATGTVNVGSSTTAGTLNANGNVALNTAGGMGGTGAVINVNGAGSIFTQSGTTTLTVGHASSGTAAINIGTVFGGSGAIFTTGTELITINKTGTVNVGSNLSTGTLNAMGDVSIVGGKLYVAEGSTFAMASGKTMTIQNSGTFGTHGIYSADAPYTVTGADSIWYNSGELHVGSTGTGSLRIEAGGDVANYSEYGHNYYGRVGANAGSNGTVTVNGAGSTWGNNSLYVGFDGTGTLRIEDGGKVSNYYFGIPDNYGVIGANAGSNGTVTVTGAGSSWTNIGSFYVGAAGTGTLAIEAGGAVSNNLGYVGYVAGGDGTVTVTGAGSTWTNSGNLYVGLGGAGSLTVSDGGTVQAANLIVGALGEVHGDGNIVGDVQSGGLVSPGASPGTLHINGNYTQAAAGKLLMEMAGTTPGTQFDTLAVTGGSATLAGTLDVDLLSFTPAPGNAFQIISASGGVSGTFGTVLLPTLTGANWQLLYGPNSVSLRVALLGDYNFNGTVDGGDYVIWRKTLNQTGTFLLADGNRNGQIDTDDYNVWRAHFGQTLPGAGSGSSSAFLLPPSSFNNAVPEPTTFVLVCGCAASGWCLLFRRKQRTIDSATDH